MYKCDICGHITETTEEIEAHIKKKHLNLLKNEDEIRQSYSWTRESPSPSPPAKMYKCLRNDYKSTSEEKVREHINKTHGGKASYISTEIEEMKSSKPNKKPLGNNITKIIEPTSQSSTEPEKKEKSNEGAVLTSKNQSTRVGEKRILYGFILFIIGIAITIGSYTLAANGAFGGWYLISFGPVIFGIYNILKGLVELAR